MLEELFGHSNAGILYRKLIAAVLVGIVFVQPDGDGCTGFTVLKGVGQQII